MIRPARRGDGAAIVALIRELAIYEHLESQAQAEPQQIEHWIFDEHKADVLIAEVDHHVVGFVLYFFSFSTFLGKPGIYMEDLFVRENYRHQGLGKQLIRALAQRCVAAGYGRLEWACLDWNQPSIDFYQSLGAVAMADWSTYRLTGPALLECAEQEQVSIVKNDS